MRLVSLVEPKTCTEGCRERIEVHNNTVIPRSGDVFDQLIIVSYGTSARVDIESVTINTSSESEAESEAIPKAEPEPKPFLGDSKKICNGTLLHFDREQLAVMAELGEVQYDTVGTASVSINLPIMQLISLQYMDLSLSIKFGDTIDGNSIDRIEYKIFLNYLSHNTEYRRYLAQSHTLNSYFGYSTYRFPTRHTDGTYIYRFPESDKYTVQELYFIGLSGIPNLRVILNGQDVEQEPLGSCSPGMYKYVIGDYGINLARLDTVEARLKISSDRAPPVMVARGYKSVVYGGGYVFDVQLHRDSTLCLTAEGHSSLELTNPDKITHVFAGFRGLHMPPKQLYSCKNLAYLDLRHNNLSNLGLGLSYFPKLRELYLQDNYLQNVDLTPCEELMYINLDNNILTTVTGLKDDLRAYKSFSLLGNPHMISPMFTHIYCSCGSHMKTLRARCPNETLLKLTELAPTPVAPALPETEAPEPEPTEEPTLLDELSGSWISRLLGLT